MKTVLGRVALSTVALALLAPASLWAHAGHAGDHGWLAGAAQPMLSLDHFLAGLFVTVVGGLGVATVAERRQRREVRHKP
jgi:hydrogenase/urease accessory protein HupE